MTVKINSKSLLMIKKIMDEYDKCEYREMSDEFEIALNNLRDWLPIKRKEITLPKLLCNRCEYSWFPSREIMPSRCAKCNSPYWNKPRRIKK